MVASLVIALSSEKIENLCELDDPFNVKDLEICTWDYVTQVRAIKILTITGQSSDRVSCGHGGNVIRDENNWSRVKDIFQPITGPSEPKKRKYTKDAIEYKLLHQQ